MAVLLFILLILVLALLGTFVYAGFRGAPWVPTRNTDINRILKLIDLKKGDVFYDLGSGDGRLVCSIAKRGGIAFGYEISLLPYLISIFRRRFVKAKCKIFFKDFWETDFRDADVVYFFLMPKIYPKLKLKLKKELKKGAKVVAYVWPFDNWRPSKIDKLHGATDLYLYKI